MTMERKNRIWITIFGKMAGIVTAIFVIASVILCIVAWCEEIYITDSPFLDGLIFLVGGFFVAFGHFVCSMLRRNYAAPGNRIRPAQAHPTNGAEARSHRDTATKHRCSGGTRSAGVWRIAA